METQTQAPTTPSLPSTANLEIVKPVLDAVATPMLLADPTLTIRYLNTAAFNLLRELQAVLPWPAHEVTGQSFALLCNDAGLRDRSRLPLQSKLVLGEHEFELAVGPYYDHRGDYLGPLIGLTRRKQDADLQGRLRDYAAQLQAIDVAMAVAEFDLDGTLRKANRNFLSLMGYELDEVRGRHHRMFVDDQYARSREYAAFWTTLASGELQQAEFQRFGKGGRAVWLQASYNPVLDHEGKPIKVIKYATDITAQRLQREQIQQLSSEAQRRAEALQTQVGVMLEVVNAAAGGDLTRKVALVEGEQALLQMSAGLDRLIGDLRKNIGSISEHAREVGAASNQLTAVSEQMAGTADETSAKVSLVNEAAEDVSRNITTVATGIEELGASMRDIAGSATEAANIATHAVRVAHSTNDTVARLGESSLEIGKIVKLITSIAQQTNLLALNATIEAARAGEAGRGFAVVANEVKELAKETATATDEISNKIEAIQKSTSSVVAAIEDIGSIINQINGYQSAIAAAVEQQSATTGAIGRNISEAARRSQEIAQNITTVAFAARDTSGAAADTQNAALQLRGMAQALQTLVGRFSI